MPTKRKAKTKRDKESSLVFNCSSCAQPQLLVQGKRNILCHPQLQVGVCRECLIFAHADIIPLDDEGYEIYCRWCSELGNLVCCDECKTPFCEECISRNVGPEYYDSLMDVDEWKCFICEPAAIENLRELTKAALDHQNYNEPSDLLLEKCSAIFNGDADVNDSDREEIVKERLRLRRNNLNETLSRKKKEKAAAESSEDESEKSDEYASEEEEPNKENEEKGKKKKTDSDSEYESSPESLKKTNDSDSDSMPSKKTKTKDSDEDSIPTKKMKDFDEDSIPVKKAKDSDEDSLPSVSVSDKRSDEQKNSSDDDSEASNKTLDLAKPSRKRGRTQSKKAAATNVSDISDSDSGLMKEKQTTRKTKSYKLSLKSSVSKGKGSKHSAKKSKRVSSDSDEESEASDEL